MSTPIIHPQGPCRNGATRGVLNTAIFSAAIAVLISAWPSLAHAEKQSVVEGKGFKCETAGVNSVVCSKAGQKDYTCDRVGNCAQLRPKAGTEQIGPTPTRPKAP